jgi:hypothetical protein
MSTLAPCTEQWQHFASDVREQFWGDLAQPTRRSWQDFLGRLSIEARDRSLGVREYERSPERTDAPQMASMNGTSSRAWGATGAGGPNATAGLLTGAGAVGAPRGRGPAVD